MNDVDQALSQISNIRAQLAASTRFQGIAPGVNVLAAVIVLLVAGVQSLYPELLGQDQRTYITLWSGVLIAISGISVIAVIARARRLHGSMAYAMLNTALQKTLPFVAAAIVITWAISAFAPKNLWLLPGLWQILIGLLGFSAVANLAREIVWAAVWYFVCGALALGFAGSSGTLSPWLMGIPFCVGHLLVALVFSRADRESHRHE